MKRVFLILTMVCFGFSVNAQRKKDLERVEAITNILKEHDLTLPELLVYHCHFVGGHPERDKESYYGAINSGIFIGAKNGKIIFFEYQNINFRVKMGQALDATEGSIQLDIMSIFPEWKVNYLFDIPIDNIVDIRYFDLQASRTMAAVGGANWAVPINMKEGEASVLIDWRDDRFYHSTEFRLSGYGAWAKVTNSRANALRNSLIKMTK